MASHTFHKNSFAATVTIHRSFYGDRKLNDSIRIAPPLFTEARQRRVQICDTMVMKGTEKFSSKKGGRSWEKRMRREILLWVIAIILGVSIVPAVSADFPVKPLSFIVPWSPGGATDVSLRVLAETTAKYLGQPVVAENKAGGGGIVKTSIQNAKYKFSN